jgi:hypothetical protein
LAVILVSATGCKPGETAEGIEWSISDDGKTLTIGGRGAMPDYDYWSRPWYGFLEDITAVIIGNGVTGSEGAFFPVAAA